MGAAVLEERHGSGMGVIPFHEIVQGWSTFFHAAEDGELGPYLRDIEAAACGFTHAILYRGARLTGDLLIAIAREQGAAMSTVRALADRDASMFISLSSPHGFLYLRQLSNIGPELSVRGPTRGWNEPAYMHCALLGSKEAVLIVSSALDAMLDRIMKNHQK